MGMYTLLVFNVELEKDVPEAVINVLEHMLDNDVVLKEKPKHPLFSTRRWDWMLRSDSYYFDADTHSTLRFDTIGDCYYLNITCNLKNYDSEIKRFLDWIMPYVSTDGFCGMHQYEESEEPTLIYNKGSNNG